jgi:hypothetical protein
MYSNHKYLYFIQGKRLEVSVLTPSELLEYTQLQQGRTQEAFNLLQMVVHQADDIASG